MLQHLFPKLRFALVAVVLLWTKTYIVYKLAFDIKIDNFFEEIMLLFNPLASLLLFFGFALLASKYRNRLIIGISFIFSFILFGNAMFYGFYNDFVTFPVLFQTNNMADLGTSIKELFTYKTLLLFADVIILMFLSRKFPKFCNTTPLSKTEKRTFFGSITALLALQLIVSIIYKPQLFSRSFDRQTVVKNLGLYTYHVFDITLQSKNSAERVFASGDGFSEIKNYVDTKDAGFDKELFGIAKGKNVILISMESTQNFVINKKINGKEITPFLNRFITDSYYFDNFYHQTGQGKTSDAEFIVENSLYPLDRGSVFFTHATNEYTATPEQLKKYGYYSAVFHSNDKTFWNRDIMYPALGYDRYFHLNDYVGTEQMSVGWGLKDKEFFEQSISKLKSLPQPFYTKFITLTNHFPFLLNPEDQYISEYHSESGVLNRYFPTVRYTDEAIKLFINRLKEEGLYDNSIIVIYGDHYGISENHNAAMAHFLGRDAITPFDSMQLQRVPLIIHIPGQKGKVISKVSGQIDLKPTLLHLLGIKTKKSIEFGTDLFLNNTNPLMIMRDGSFVTNDYIYTKNICYKKSTGEPTDLSFCQPYLEKAKTELNYSDKIIYGDLLRFDSNNQYKTGTMTTQFE
ncbi:MULTISPECIES: LTA synthase family protein [Bacillus cereus group]|uniref:LTA synthase family protein n=1 Tax=Bacillus cereus group TaxID=86661 RepID=UPI001AED3448|nr:MULTISPECIES: LTA synthase family protein [Bacillus cereus group]QTR72223.1 LTA synthase family protein [Bacillus cytotoxicus]QTR77358.1 LTA synthase family protein [Bacillus cytotoxicus]HDR4570569.1 LTA synthase family protein [Bacillus cytotoxicus]HDR4586381.1 LTA synthase family protein [Bacillus cytotoxicus]HDR7314345.1 LTA synthase family protein [Bacillus cytotoxicus]